MKRTNKGSGMMPAVQWEGEVQACSDRFHPLTADTVTDEQIRELYDSLESGDTHAQLLCNQALGRALTIGLLAPGMNSAVNVRTARRACAQIINARYSEVA